MTSSDSSPQPRGSMVAYRYKHGVQHPVAERLSVPRPKPDEVLLRVLAGGVCHSDLAALNPTSAIGKSIARGTKSFTFGHEGAGKATCHIYL